MKNLRIVLDFDGVIHDYKGWKGVSVIDGGAVPGVIEKIIEYVKEGLEVNIYSSRSAHPGGRAAMQEFVLLELAKHYNEESEAQAIFDSIVWPISKPAAYWGTDDRVDRFTGALPSVEYIRDFKPWNR
jgi:hypothetical protein